jgi:BCD family chlorophyll transporter-like MFS transporter
MTALSPTRAAAPGLGWAGILRLGLVQTALGAIVVLTTSTLNRVMVVELALPAMLPGLLVGLHYAIEVLRPRWGYGSDMGGRRTPWIVGGMAVLALGGTGAAASTALMASHTALGIAAAIASFLMIGAGVGAAGTALLALLATRTAPGRRAAAASIVWIMMIAGFAVTTALASGFLEPFSLERLVAVTATVSALAFTLSLLAVWGMEPPAARAAPMTEADGAKPPFRQALREVWADPEARRFAVFVAISMLAYNTQDLILEPFAGSVFGMTPAESTRLSSTQHQGVLIGMILVALFGSAIRRGKAGTLKLWIVGGCTASAVAIAAIGFGGFVGPSFPLAGAVFALGAANGAFAVAAIASMMALAGAGGHRREGTRLGVWGAAQAAAFGLGGFVGTVLIDLARSALPSDEIAYASVFAIEAVLFLIAAKLALSLANPALVAAAPTPRHPDPTPVPTPAPPMPEPAARFGLAGGAGD